MTDNGKVNNRLISILVPRIRILGWLAAALSAVILCGPYLAFLPWTVGLFFENISHFRILGMLAAFFAAATSFKNRALLYSSAILCVMHFSAVMVYSWGAPITTSGRSDRLRICYANIGWPQDRDPRQLLSWIEQENPDIVLFAEYDEEAVREIEPTLSSLYANKHLHPRADRFGLALFSKLPISDSWIGALDRSGVPALSAAIGGAAFDLWLLHPLPPNTVEQRRWRDEAITRMAELAKMRTRPMIVMGDLNATERIGPFSKLCDAGLIDSRRGFGWSPSWPSFKLGARESLFKLIGIPLAIPIDHAFVTDDVVLLDRRLGTPNGSDHLPLIIDVQIEK